MKRLFRRDCIDCIDWRSEKNTCYSLTHLPATWKQEMLAHLKRQCINFKFWDLVELTNFYVMVDFNLKPKFPWIGHNMGHRVGPGKDPSRWVLLRVIFLRLGADFTLCIAQIEPISTLLWHWAAVSIHSKQFDLIIYPCNKSPSWEPQVLNWRQHRRK